MQEVKELQRQPAPAGRPQPLAFYHGRLWIGCWDVDKIYGIEAKNWDVTDEFAAPGRPYGLAAFGGGLAVVVALEDDNRYLFRFTREDGFDTASKTACPDFTGSHLTSDGTTLYLSQLGKRKILALDGAFGVTREIAMPTRWAGLAFEAPGKAFTIAADEEFDNLEFACVDLSQAQAGVETIAPVPPEWRGLAFDGTSWWTSVREEGEIAEFGLTG